ncbi:MAG: 2-oxoglutarate dehydrogenase E1 component [Legionellales bacterium RIFCSPHIGHO2_12_FULL_35_11]|nr:MAG: 2-oxoglutarate dehydrogenase E1 component [Legionellales bacterium RIFCSPHIGHO2_12_FULL_35_11]
MSSDSLQQEWADAYLSGGNMAYVDGLYEEYLQNPKNISADWKGVFDGLSVKNGNGADISHQDIRDYFLNLAKNKSANIEIVAGSNKQMNVTDLINSYRAHGHHAANLDPLEMAHKLDIPSLELKFHNLTEANKNELFYAGDTFSESRISLEEIYKQLRETYCSNIGLQYMHISSTEETKWIEEKFESVRGKGTFSTEKQKQILGELITADGLERYLATRYVGQKRFSLEGGDALIPMMNEIVRRSCHDDVKEVVIGMAHRGRLNVLINVLGKKPEVLFQEFEGTINQDISGDVKYHLGFSSDISTEPGKVTHVVLAFNPSHLEIIGPVVEGSARSRLHRLNDLKEKKQVIPVVIHGDAAFAGQGVVMETFNFSQSPGYSTGGTIHVVINNQIGFTTSEPHAARSTYYCTEIAKMVQAPIIHVNGNDPEAVVFATKLAFEYRMKFKKDVVLDLVCFRRNGHNEADEPSITQPLMYQKIKTMLPLQKLYAEKLISLGVVTPAEVDEMIEKYRQKIDKGEPVVNLVKDSYKNRIGLDWDPYISAKWTDQADTSIKPAVLKDLTQKNLNIPESFIVHPVVKRLLEERQKMSDGELLMNWGFAEHLAYASLLDEGYEVRLSGQDCGRGTFAHRHAVLHDQKTGEKFIPLNNAVRFPQKDFLVIDSVLSEEAVLAFEYGYSSCDPTALVLWEAQFGDFANGAQVVIDQFISSGEQKWGRLCGLVMLLPHGYEGQGPEHSSARLERYMQLCAQQNIQVCTPTTPAQIFHLLRRQMLRKLRKPLIIMTPKSLLRHKLAVSSMEDLTSGSFHNVIPEIDDLESKKVTRVVLCCGKVYYDLLQKRRDDNLENVAIVRLEQLYPFPHHELEDVLAKYPKVKSIVWCQEEPQNQGVWFSSQHNIELCLKPDQTLSYAGRGFAAAPAGGSSKAHAEQQAELVNEALTKNI